MRKLFFLILALSLGAIYACTENVDVEADRKAVLEASRKITSALNKGDVDEIMNILTADHITMAPNEPAFDDMAKLRKWHETRYSLFDVKIEITSQEIILLGDWAYQYHINSSKAIQKESGDIVTDSGKGIWIWKRQTDGIWKLARSIWNSDLPLPNSN